MKQIYLSLILIAALFSGQSVNAQTVKIKYLSAMQKEVPAAEAHYFEEIKKYSSGGGTHTRYLAKDSTKVSLIHYNFIIDGEGPVLGTQHGPVYEWYPNGQLKTKMAYHTNKWNGPYTTWYENGQIRQSSKYKMGIPLDTLKVYYETGVLRRVEVYELGKMVSGGVYDANGNSLDFIPMDGGTA